MTDVVIGVQLVFGLGVYFQSDACLIDDVCYADGDLNPEAWFDKCKAASSQSKWTFTGGE